MERYRRDLSAPAKQFATQAGYTDAVISDAEVAAVDQAMIGPRLRAARLAKGLTLEAVANTVGLTQGYVSKLERDQVSPSVASLVAICRAVGLRVGDLFEQPRTAIVRAGQGAPINFGGIGAHETVITPGGQSHVEVIEARIDPSGNAGGAPYTLDCDVEFVYVIDGSLDVLLNDETFSLTRGDSMTFSGRDPHNWLNPSATESSHVIWVLAPAP